MQHRTLQIKTVVFQIAKQFFDPHSAHIETKCGDAVLKIGSFEQMIRKISTHGQPLTRHSYPIFGTKHSTDAIFQVVSALLWVQIPYRPQENQLHCQAKLISHKPARQFEPYRCCVHQYVWPKSRQLGWLACDRAYLSSKADDHNQPLYRQRSNGFHQGQYIVWKAILVQSVRTNL